MGIVVVDEAKLVAIADEIRSKRNAAPEPMTLDGMKDNIQHVYADGAEAGWESGFEQGEDYGIEQERKKLWGALQNYGKGTNYRYAFCYTRFEDKTFNPQYDIVCTNAESAAQNMFYDSCITDTKVPIYAPNTNINNAFLNSDIKIIRLLVVHESTAYTSTFTGCSELESLTMGGTIGKAFSVHACVKLNKESIISVINTLSTNTSGIAVAFSKDAVNKAFGIDVDDPSTYPEGSEWYELRNSRSNWTFSFS